MKRYAILAVFMALSIVATAPISETLAANYSWAGTSASWSVAAEWNPSTVPGPADTAWILDDGTASIGAFVNASCGTLVLGGNFGGNVQLANSLTVGGGGELVGYKGNGQFNQTSGTNSTTGGLVLGNNTGSSGSYNLSSGELTTFRQPHRGQFRQRNVYPDRRRRKPDRIEQLPRARPKRRRQRLVQPQRWRIAQFAQRIHRLFRKRVVQPNRRHELCHNKRHELRHLPRLQRRQHRLIQSGRRIARLALSVGGLFCRPGRSSRPAAPRRRALWFSATTSLQAVPTLSAAADC